jgi:23S rRNA pseudouridine2605 synthase
MAMRLHKIIALAGIASRREAERLIEQGQVTVNGTVVRKQGSLADPAVDRIKVKGRLVPMPEKKVYILFNKPRGCVTTTRDERDRPTVMDFIKVPERVFPVGRLDYNTEGLLLLTNDGDLSEKLLDPVNKVPRTYRVKVRGVPDAKVLARFKKGVPVDGQPAQPIQASIFRVTGKNSVLTLILVEGKNRHIRKVCEKVGHPVVKLQRIEFGKLDLANVPAGAYRFLSPREIRSLRSLVKGKKG